MFSHSRAQHSDTHAGGTSMRLLKYVPQIACAAILLIGSFSATLALGQVINSALTMPNPTFTSSTNGAGGPIDYGGAATFTIMVSVPAGVANATGVTLNGVFAPGNSTPQARVTGFGAGALGAGCVNPDPASPGNPNSFQCTIGGLDDGAAPVRRTVVVRLAAPTSSAGPCPPVVNSSFMVTASATNELPVPRTVPGPDTEDFADLSVSLSGPEGANVGDTVRFNVTITNFGPCRAENICASNGNAAVGLVFVSNAGGCTRPYGACSTGSARYNPSSECGFSTSPTAPGGFLDPGQSFNITSTYTIDVLPRSVTSIGDSNEVDIVSDTNLINFAAHSQSALTSTLVQQETSCSVAGTGGSSIAVVGLVVLVAYALNRRRRS